MTLPKLRTVKLPSIAEAPARGLPQLHARWLEAALGGKIPSEPYATCESCAMLPGPDGVDENRDVAFFNPKTKCCTYLPKLSNFLVGAILADGSPEMAQGRERVLQRIGKRVGVTPFGLGASGAYDLIYENMDDSVNGRSESMRCPYYLEDRIGGGCGIWRHRNAVCMTWFCKHERGVTAKRFWDSVNELFGVVEENLAFHCLVTLDFDDAALRAGFPLQAPHPGKHTGTVKGDELDGTVSPERYRALWGSWIGRKQELYRKCDAIVRDMEWREVERIGGATVTFLLRLTRAAYRAATGDDLPDRLEIGDFHVIGMGLETVRLATYSPYDPVDAPAALLPALSAFDGSKVADAVRAIEKDYGLVLRPGLVRKLVDFGLLRGTPAPHK